jgi:hypothetical protein
MISSLSFTDSLGTVTFTNGKPGVATRFADWVVHRKPVGPAAVGLGTGLIHRFRFRTDQTASFSINHIPESSMEDMVRLEDHLLNGGTIFLAGDREMAGQFSPATLAPGTEPDFSQSDSQLREYTFSVTIRSTAFSTSTSGSSGTAPVEPPEVDDLMIWYKADALFAEGYGGGEFPTEWVDSSGNGYDAAPDIHAVTSPESAKFYANWPLGGGVNDLNGMPLMYFQAAASGAGAQMASPAYPASSVGRTFFILARIEGAISASKAFASVGGDIRTTFHQYEESFGVASGAWGWDQPTLELGGSIESWCIASVILTTTTGQCYINGLALGGSFTPAATLVTDIGGVDHLISGNIILGGYDLTGGGNNASCVIAESLMYNRALTTTEHTGIIAYLAAKYDL